MGGWRDGWAGERRGQGGSIGLALLLSKKKKRKITLSFTSPEKEKYIFYIYEVFTSPEKAKRSTMYYLGFREHGHPTTMGAGFKLEGGVHRQLIFYSSSSEFDAIDQLLHMYIERERERERKRERERERVPGNDKSKSIIL